MPDERARDLVGVIESAQALCAVVHSDLPREFSATGALAPAIAFAGLVRSANLLSAMCSIVRWDSGDAIGGLLRVLAETYVASIYVLRGGDQAVEAWARSDHARRAELAGHQGWDIPPWQPLGGGTWDQSTPTRRERISYRGLVNRAMDVATASEQAFIQDQLDVIYGSESHRSIHGSMMALFAHIEVQDSRLMLVRGGMLDNPDFPRVRLLSGRDMLYFLAHAVYEELGQDRSSEIAEAMIILVPETEDT